MPLRGIAPGWLSAFESALHRFNRFAQHERNAFVRVQSVADEERHHDDILRSCQPVAISDARLLFHEHGMHFRVNVSRADEFDLSFDGCARVFVVARAVAGDEQSDVLPLGRCRPGMFLNNFTGARQQHVRHAVVRADRTAVVNRPAAAPLRAGKIGSIIGAKAEFARDDFLGEITFADEQRNDEDTRRKHAPQHAANGRLEFPEAFEHLREKVATAQFIRVLIRRRGGIRVQRRAMADQHQRGVGKVII